MSDIPPTFRVVRGVPTAEELAALVGVLAARSRPAAAPAQEPISWWARSARPGAFVSPSWRTSALPR
jgi:hypothetical protein